MEDNREKLLKEIMAADFMLIDLNLYLDTHPNDQRAIMLYNQWVQQSMLLKQNYQRMYGPLTQNMFQSKCPWQWIQSPWPWQR